MLGVAIVHQLLGALSMSDAPCAILVNIRLSMAQPKLDLVCIQS